jgi:hypothetical protein
MMNKFDDVPADHIETILQLETWLNGLVVGLPRGDDRTRYLFEIYNEYWGGSTIMEEHCNSCLGKVLRKTFEAIEHYKNGKS